MSFFNLKGLPQPLLAFWGAERPLTQLLKTAFTFTLSQHTLRQEGREHGVFKQMEPEEVKNSKMYCIGYKAVFG